MSVHADKTEGNKSQLTKNNVAQKSTNNNTSFQFVDNRSTTAQMKELQEMANDNLQAKQAVQLKTIQRKEGIEEEELLQGKFETVQRKQSSETKAEINTKPIQKKENNTGLPDNLKSGIENLSGYAMDDVQVHYNSDKPAQLQAHAYAQGTDIHLASGQEKHLPHEAWHVVQQKQGRVKPTMQMKGKVNINDDKGLEKEADVMGAKAMQMKHISGKSETRNIGLGCSNNDRGLQTQRKSDILQKKGKYNPSPTIDAVGAAGIAELEYGSGPTISFTAISSCIGLIGRNGGNVIGIHIPLKDEDGTLVSTADLAALSGLIAGIVAGCSTLYYVGEKTVWEGSNASVALAAVTAGFTGIMFGSGVYSASIDPTDVDEIIIKQDGTKVWPVL